MLRSEERNVINGQDEAFRKVAWTSLLTQLRSLSPKQKISYTRQSRNWMNYRDLVLDGVEVRIRIDYAKGEHFSFSSKRPRRYYFTIGRYHRSRRMTRAICGKNGFNWPRVAHLVESERKFQADTRRAEQHATETRESASAKLDQLFKRRPELDGRRAYIGVSEVDGTFSYTVHNMEIGALEAVLDVAHAVDRGEAS